MSMPGGAPSKARLRIKGHWQSVIRFFFIAVGFMMAWVLITSELGYYARWFGPQILLQLNFAFYLPSIPVLVISGQLEKVLDDRFGPISSMMIRLNVGLAGSAAICAAFPFVTRTQTALLWIVALLGTLSAIAFSTSYQLVQWFRHADIIALGIGGVGSGPLVLLIQLGLVYVKAWPQRWQWVAMFEITAGIVLLGLLSSLSLFGQYWGVLAGEIPYEDVCRPLLHDELRDDGDDESGSGSGSGGFGSPQGSGPWYHPTVELMSPEEQAHEQHLSRALAPAGTIILAPDPFHGGLPFIFQSPSFNWEVEPPPALYPRSRSLETGWADTWSGPDGEGTRQYRRSATLPVSDAALQLPKGGQNAGQQGDHSSLMTAAGSDGLAAADGAALPSSQQHHQAIVDPFALPSVQQQVAQHLQQGAYAAGSAAGAAEAEGGAARRGMSLAEETRLTLTLIWPVLFAFLISVSILYMVFPFFTYIPSSGLLGDTLPRVLFFTRIGADIVGRFAPRIKSLVTRSPGVLLMLSLIKVTVATLLIVYIKAPDRMHHDALAVAVIIFLWIAGGYVNTCANILAPALVPDHLCARASALMALTFQIAHFAGLVLAALLVFVMYGDVVG